MLTGQTIFLEMYVKITLLVLIALFFECYTHASPSYYEVKALSGDGIYSMLRRYKLDQNSCNFDEFYNLNKLRKNAPLKVGKTYYVPILIYEFDGKTIRSSVGIKDWNTAVRIQKYNEEMVAQKLCPALYKEGGPLWVPYHELNCPEVDLEIPAPVDANPEEENIAAGKRIFPIFGKTYAYTPLSSNRLKGKVFFISSGHGGPDPGAMGTRAGHTLCEDEYAYDVALRLCRLLVSNGATAYMVLRDPNDGIRDEEYLDCDEDEQVWGGASLPFNQKARLFQRSNTINELYEKHRLQGITDQVAIMIHVDSRSRGERTDVYFYHHADSEEGKDLAEQLQQTFKAKYKQYRAGGYYHGTVTSRSLHMLRECEPTSVYIELANIRNYGDQQRLVVQKNRQLLAEWLYEGLTK